MAFIACPTALTAQERPGLDDSLVVNSISLTGNTAFPDEQLMDGIQLKESPSGFSVWIYNNISERFGSEPQYFDYEIFMKDIENLQQFYKNNGFFLAVVEGDFARHGTANAVDVRFLIHEGPPSMIDSIYSKYQYPLPPDVMTLLGERVIAPGQRYAADRVQQEIQRVLAILSDNGYPNCSSAGVTVERKLSNNAVTVKLPFYFGRRLYFGRITEDIRGVDELNLTRALLYDKLDFKEGDVYSNTRKEQGVTNLHRLGIFSNVQALTTIPSPRDTATERIPVTLVLYPKKKHDLEPGVLVNNYFGRFNTGLEVSYLLRNVFGAAQTLTAKAGSLFKLPRVSFSPFGLAFDAYQFRLQLRYDQPYFSSSKNSFYATVTYLLAKEIDLYDGSIRQGSIGFRRQLGATESGTIDWTLEQSDYSSLGSSLVNSPFARFDTTGINYFNSILSLTLESDGTNDYFNPTSGVSLKGIFEEAGLFTLALKSLLQRFQTTEYVKFEGVVKAFHDVSRNQTSIFGWKIRGGTIFRYGNSKSDDVPVPFNRRYYAGGSTSVRAWTVRALAADATNANFGGNALIESSAELRWKPFPNSRRFLFLEPNLVWFVFFVDAGNLWSEAYKIRVNEMAMAFGIGLRYNIIVPLRLDFGMKFHDPNADTNRWFWQRRFFPETVATGVIQLGIGHAF